MGCQSEKGTLLTLSFVLCSLLNVIADRLAAWGHDIDLGYWFLEENPTWLGPLLMDDSIGVTKTPNHVNFEPSMYTEECALPTELDRLYAYFKSPEVYLHKSYHDIRYNHVEFKPLGMYSGASVINSFIAYTFLIKNGIEELTITPSIFIAFSTSDMTMLSPFPTTTAIIIVVIVAVATVDVVFACFAFRCCDHCLALPCFAHFSLAIDVASTTAIDVIVAAIVAIDVALVCFAFHCYGHCRTTYFCCTIHLTYNPAHRAVAFLSEPRHRSPSHCFPPRASSTLAKSFL
ncbi:unnamed protein product [Prunus armeniaca]|uniref:Uncharacterized protein n=1 Tax=Prunus armeniaca TaxID=36596 RepID=A0A6J5WF69_PRUAR|nr:unnamed protein product [Prunus armeniaca]